MAQPPGGAGLWQAAISLYSRPRIAGRGASAAASAGPPCHVPALSYLHLGVRNPCASRLRPGRRPQRGNRVGWCEACGNLATQCTCCRVVVLQRAGGAPAEQQGAVACVSPFAGAAGAVPAAAAAAAAMPAQQQVAAPSALPAEGAAGSSAAPAAVVAGSTPAGQQAASATGGPSLEQQACAAGGEAVPPAPWLGMGGELRSSLTGCALAAMPC